MTLGGKGESGLVSTSRIRVVFNGIIFINICMKTMTQAGTPHPGEKVKRKLGFFLSPGFAPLGVFGAIEVLRITNNMMGEACYGWQLISLDGKPVTSANGIGVEVSKSMAQAGNFDMVFVCSGYHPELYCDEETLSWIRNLTLHGTSLGAISTGTHILAKTGIIGTRRCTIHADNAASLREEFPNINLVNSVFDIDQGLYTCAGGTSALDLFINIVSEVVDEKSAAAIAHQLLQDRVRDPQDIQSKSKRMNLRIKSQTLGDAIDLMEDNIEEPLSILEIAAALKISQRQLQRVFKRHLGQSPKETYAILQMNQSRLLLLQTTLPIIEISIASGFSSHVHFSKCYRAHFGCSPTAERRKAR